MPDKEIENIQDFFPGGTPQMTPEEKWDAIFYGWINKIDQKNLNLNLFELKLWLESLEAFFTSTYLEKQMFRFIVPNQRNYEFYLSTFNLVSNRIIMHLKELDFKKDKYSLNFEEYIVESILESYMVKSLPYLRDVYVPESWFYSLRIFLQNIRTLAMELVREDTVPQKTYSSLKKLYHKELISNPIIISLLRRRFIPKMDKIYQPDISSIISTIRNKQLRKQLGVFFVFSYRILRINNFIESNLKKVKNIDVTIPLILVLKRNLEHLFSFYEKHLEPSMQKEVKDKSHLKKVRKVYDELNLEYQKIFEGELPNFFADSEEKLNKRKIVKNIIMISDLANQELIETVAQLFQPEISGSNIFERYISRKEQSRELKDRLSKLNLKINNYFNKKGNINQEDVLFDLNLFIENNVNYLSFKEWNKFLGYYNNLIKINFSSEFDLNLKSFNAFVAGLLKESEEQDK
jgi:hypothetical protein